MIITEYIYILFKDFLKKTDLNLKLDEISVNSLRRIYVYPYIILSLFFSILFNIYIIILKIYINQDNIVEFFYKNNIEIGIYCFIIFIFFIIYDTITYCYTLFIYLIYFNCFF